MTDGLGFQVTQLEVERDLLKAHLAAVLAALEAILDADGSRGRYDAAENIAAHNLARQAISLAKEQTP